MSQELGPSEITKQLPTTLMGSSVVSLGTTTSTMDIAHTEANRGAPEGTLIIAETQTAGRGRFSRSWISKPGESLNFTILLRPTLRETPNVNMAASLAIIRAIESVTQLRATIKWPNDIQISGKKLAGILIESHLDEDGKTYTIIGIGINVNFDPSTSPHVRQMATSLKRELDEAVSRLALLRDFLTQFDKLYAQIRGGRSVLREWIPHVGTLGKHVEVRWGNRSENGIAKTVDDDGNLIVQRLDGTKISLPAGEVTLR
ncbi:MAG: biotin--[acetyl-CoA-carboxylase] ligase [SAR202 cluster bacterium]|nr:biotin--[acetyl-CoA-carboxylase] ligase [SAR202 cluster bacterium]